MLMLLLRGRVLLLAAHRRRGDLRCRWWWGRSTVPADSRAHAGDCLNHSGTWLPEAALAQASFLVLVPAPGCRPPGRATGPRSRLLRSLAAVPRPARSSSCVAARKASRNRSRRKLPSEPHDAPMTHATPERGADCAAVGNDGTHQRF